MARIRCIKPEFPQSESIGRISRDSRLTFIQLWTIADDEGRLRGNSRMLASLLFPYDDDAPGLVDGWLAELESEACITRYKSEGQSYIQICNWLIHQKIDKPSKSKIPPFVVSSRSVANPREVSSEDLRKGSKDLRIEGSKEGSEEQRAPEIQNPTPELKPETLATMAMIQSGMTPTGVNPHDPRLSAAIAEGVTPEMLGAVALRSPAKGQAWVIATARGQMADARAGNASASAGAVAAVAQHDHSKTMAEVLRGQH